MLTEAELQEMRGMAFDRLLLRLWPRGPRNSIGSEKGYADLLVAKRLGISLRQMRYWRAGQGVPRLSTLRRMMPYLELEFGVPSEIWLEALEISNYARGYVLADSGLRFIPSQVSAPIFPLPAKATGQRLGYWLVLRPVRRIRGSGLVVEAKCLLCQSAREVRLNNLRHGHNKACKSCAVRLWRTKKVPEGIKGAHLNKRRRRWVVQQRETGRRERSFSDPRDAARYYDSCMYERYGHTLFLNFPDEYDQSNDPVFVPVKRIGDS